MNSLATMIGADRWSGQGNILAVFCVKALPGRFTLYLCSERTRILLVAPAELPGPFFVVMLFRWMGAGRAHCNEVDTFKRLPYVPSWHRAETALRTARGQVWRHSSFGFGVCTVGNSLTTLCFRVILTEMRFQAPVKSAKVFLNLLEIFVAEQGNEVQPRVKVRRVLHIHLRQHCPGELLGPAVIGEHSLGRLAGKDQNGQFAETQLLSATENLEILEVFDVDLVRRYVPVMQGFLEPVLEFYPFGTELSPFMQALVNHELGTAKLNTR